PDFVPSHTYEYNVEKARALVEECGNMGRTVTIKSYNTEPYQTLSVWLQGTLSAIGLDAKVDTMERSAFSDQLLNGEVEICPFSWSDVSFDFGAAVGIYMVPIVLAIPATMAAITTPKPTSSSHWATAPATSRRARAIIGS
ncbi:MAG: ABC transporter substrate-binding protein, partial [Christensenellales bacterium]